MQNIQNSRNLCSELYKNVSKLCIILQIIQNFTKAFYTTFFFLTKLYKIANCTRPDKTLQNCTQLYNNYTQPYKTLRNSTQLCFLKTKPKTTLHTLYNIFKIKNYTNIQNLPNSTQIYKILSSFYKLLFKFTQLYKTFTILYKTLQNFAKLYKTLQNLHKGLQNFANL
jgi:hypothetical protein